MPIHFKKQRRYGFVPNEVLFAKAREQWLQKRLLERAITRAWHTGWYMLGVVTWTPLFVVIGCVSIGALGRELVKTGTKLQRYGW
jgi:hypothetical protein